MSLGLRKKKLKSSDIIETLVERLNKLCNFLGEEYNVNAGGCCYLAYCIAEMLTQDNLEFKVIVYEDFRLGSNFKDIEIGRFHYALSINNLIINPDGCDEDTSLYENTYCGVTASDILEHYRNSDWNTTYNRKKNKFLFKTVKMFYEDLTEDLREG